jgi:hypothetical protein
MKTGFVFFWSRWLWETCPEYRRPDEAGDMPRPGGDCAVEILKMETRTRVVPCRGQAMWLFIGDFQHWCARGSAVAFLKRVFRLFVRNFGGCPDKVRTRRQKTSGGVKGGVELTDETLRHSQAQESPVWAVSFATSLPRWLVIGALGLTSVHGTDACLNDTATLAPNTDIVTAN